MRWDQATGVSTAVTSDGISLYPQTDGLGVAWESRTVSLLTPFSLITHDLSSGATAVLSTGMSSFKLANGLLGWVDQTSVGTYVVTSQAIRAWDGATTTTLPSLLNSVFFGSSGGYVAFQESGKLYAWSPASGRTLLFDGPPGQVHLTGKTVYFVQQVLYAVTLP